MTYDSLVKHIRSRLDPLAEDLADLLWDRIDGQIASVLEVSKSALLSELEGEKVEKVPIGRAPVDPVEAGKAIRNLTARAPLELDRDAFLGTTNVGRAPRIFPAARSAHVAATAEDSPRARVVERREAGENIPAPPPPPTPHNKGGQMVCSKCSVAGHNARSCGRAPKGRPRSIKPPPAPASDDEDSGDSDVPPPRRHGRPRRSDAIVPEMPVIPHLALVAMLAADRAATAGGDAGGFVARTELEPSLIGHVDSFDMREVCPAHGWVGRFASARCRGGRDRSAVTDERTNRC